MSTDTDISISAPLRSEESCLSRSFVSGMLFMLPVGLLVLLANLSRGTRTHYSPRSAVSPTFTYPRNHSPLCTSLVGIAVLQPAVTPGAGRALILASIYLPATWIKHLVGLG